MTPSLQGAEVCPHCGATGYVEPSASLRWRCAVCGGGRVPGIAASELGAAAVDALARARRGRAVDVGATIGGGVLLASATATALLAAITLMAHAVGAGVAFVTLAALLAVGAFALFATARRNGRAWREARDEAWVDAASRMATARGGEITAPALAEATRIAEVDAEQILARMAVSRARVSIDDQAQLHYRVEPAPAADPVASESETAPTQKEQAR